MSTSKPALSSRRAAFCVNIVNGQQQKDAAINAGFSVVGAGPLASKLVRDKSIKAEIKRLRDERNAVVEADESRRLKDHYESPLDLLIDVMNNPDMPWSVRYSAAKDALPYTNAKPLAKGKKKDAKDDAVEAAGGKFGVARKPQLRSVA